MRVRRLKSLASTLRIDAGVLAGGLSSRMDGKEKAFQIVRDQPMITWILNALTSDQIEHVWINCNRNIDQYKHYSRYICQDRNQSFQGPLEGILSLMSASSADYLVLSPCDTPFIPKDYASVMLDFLFRNASSTNLPLCIAAESGGRQHPLHCCLATSLESNLLRYLNAGNNRVFPWIESLNPLWIEYDQNPDPFQNINTSEELLKANQAS